MARTNDGEFIIYLMETFGKLPNDPFYEDINPYLRVLLYEGWVHKLEVEAEKDKNQAIFLGSFFNHEMAMKMVKAENPDFESTNVDETAKMVREQILENKKTNKKRKNRKVVSDG